MEDVLADRVVVGSKIKQLVKRHYDDLDNGKDRGLFFDEQEAIKGINFIANLRHTKGIVARKKFMLQPWQYCMLALLYGWRKDDGSRRFSTLYLTMGRKNAKTETVSAIAVKALMADGEYGADIYFCATKREQAKIGYKAARTMIKLLCNDSTRAFNNTKILQHEVNIPQYEGHMTYLSSDHDTLDGYNPHMAVIDEFHAHKTSGVLDVMRTGQGARSNPLLAITTTAGFNINGPCFALQRVCGEVLQGFKQDDSLLPFVFTLDPGDDWQDEAVWAKPNPNLDVSVNRSFLREQVNAAVNEGQSKEIQVRTKNMNQWTSSSSTWISDSEWMRNKQEIDWNAMKGRPCYLGLDLASVRDFCALAVIFPMGDYSIVKVYHYMPEERMPIREKNDGVPFSRWAKETDKLVITKSKTTDYRYIKKKINELREIYDVKSMAYDRTNASQLVFELSDEGLECTKFGQGFLSMSEPTKNFEREVVAGTIKHEGDPILRWEYSNVMLQVDAAGNIKIDKKKSSEKVDGPVAVIMAYGEMTSKEHSGTSDLSRFGIRYIG